MKKFALTLALLVLISIATISAKKRKNPFINVKGFGEFEGIYKTTSWTQKQFSTFLDIRYAKKIREGTRFKAPIPAEPFDGTYDAKSYKGYCPGIKDIDTLEEEAASRDSDDYDSDDDSERNNEDCLFLTISTRNRRAKDPVLVYLAGSDLQSSNNEEAAPEYFLEKDVVLVSVQYRVGVFGFLSTGTETIPGNVGILDVIEALRWIQKYISHFGGDPKKVTIFGQHRAAAIAHVLTITPILEKEELFNQVIYHSGSALLKDIASSSTENIAKQIGRTLKCKNTSDMDKLNACLISANTPKLLKAYRTYLEKPENPSLFTIDGPSGVLDNTPEDLVLQQQFRVYNSMGGVVKHPAMGLNDFSQTEETYEFFIKELSNMLFYSVNNTEHYEILQKKFPYEEFKRNVFKSIVPGIIDLESLDVKDSTSRVLQANSESGAVQSYLYAFNYLGEKYREYSGSDIDFDGVALTDENLYLFPYPDIDSSLNRRDRTIAKLMIDLWTSFAKNGVPDSTGLITNWPAVNPGHVGPYLIIDEIPEISWDYGYEFFNTLLNSKSEFIIEI